MMNVSLQRGFVCFALSLPTSTFSDTLKGVSEYLLKSENPDLSPNPALTLLPGHIHLAAKTCVSSFPSYILGLSIVLLLPSPVCFLTSYNRGLY